MIKIVVNVKKDSEGLFVFAQPELDALIMKVYGEGYKDGIRENYSSVENSTPSIKYVCAGV